MASPYGWVPGKENYRPIRTLFDCALYRLNLRITCLRCKHTAIIDAPGRWWQCEKKGWDDTIRAYSNRLICGQCWRDRGVKVRRPHIEQTNERATEALLNGPDEYEWKRIVNRQRS